MQKNIETQVKTLFDKAGLAGATTLSEAESKHLLSLFNIPVTREKQAENLDSVLSAAASIGYPVALKACSPFLLHKTEDNLVELNLTTPVDLSNAFLGMSRQVKDKNTGFLVQEMVSGKREFVAGLVRDPLYGPCVMFGLGGIFTEALADVSFCMAPLTKPQALEMIAQTKACALLESVRGMPAADKDAVADILVALGRIGQMFPEIQQIDINPLIIRGSKPVAVDALVVFGKKTDSKNTCEMLSSASVENQNQEQSPGQDLAPLFSPSSVAIIGASGKRHKAGNDVIRNLLANGYTGDIHLVNPKGGQILGIPVLLHISDLPDNVDQAIIILPAKANPQAIRECAAKGIRYMVLAAGGFAEADDRGKSLQTELESAIKETGVRVLGPNTSGHTSTPHNYTSSFFPLGKVPKGGISYLAQTGNFATHTMRYIATAEHFGVARVIGLGNKLDIDETMALDYLGNDPETTAVICYLESIKHPVKFIACAAEITKKKPVIVLKGGSSDQGAGAAMAHTAALASDRRITESAFRKAGIVQIWHYSHLILAGKALSCMPLPRGNNVGIVAPSGAMLVSLTDLCHRRLNLNVPDVGEGTCQRLQQISPDIVRMRNPVDIWPSATVHGPEFAYKEGIEALLQDPAVDAVVAVLMLTNETGVPPLDFIVDLARQHPDKPLYITFSAELAHMDEAKKFLEPKGVPTFALIEQPFEVLSILADCQKAMDNP